MNTNVPALKITDTGVESPEYDDILSGTLEDFNQAFGGAMNKDITTPQGQISVSMSYAIDNKNNEFLYLAQQFNPDFASGRFQDALGQIYFLERIPARGTTVTAKCTGLVGTLIPKGSYAQDDMGYLYYSAYDATIPESGVVEVIFVNEIVGDIACPIGALNKIYRAVIGWDSIYNETSGALGQLVESRNDFEYRRRNSVALNSKNQNGSILANVLKVSGVVDAYVYSNDKKVSIQYGATKYTIAPNSLCISVYGGDPKDITQAIWEKKNPGCGFTGNRTEIVKDTDGYSEPYPSYEITYLIPESTNIKFKVTLIKNDGLPADIDTQIKNTITSIFTGKIKNHRARIAGVISSGRYYAAISDLSEFIDIESIRVGKKEGDFTNSIELGIDEMPVIDAKDIEVIIQ